MLHYGLCLEFGRIIFTLFEKSLNKLIFGNYPLGGLFSGRFHSLSHDCI